MDNRQELRRKRLDKLGVNLQNRLSTYFMDVQRLTLGIGFTTVISNVPVNASIKAADNPNPAAIATLPVIFSAKIHMPPDFNFDVRNDDTLTIKILSKDGLSWKSAYRGVCGNPYVVNSRKRVNMTMQALGAGDINVIPPPELDIPITESGRKRKQA